MPDPITSTILRARASYNRFLPDISTNSRTSLSRACRLSEDKGRQWRPKGLPTYMRQPEWDIRFLFGDLVKQGDTEVVTRNGNPVGTFVVVGGSGPDATPASYAVNTIALCLQTLDENGDDVSPLVTTDTVVFARNGSSNRATLVTAKAVVSQLTYEDIQLFGPEAAGVKYKAIWDVGVHYGSDVTDVPREMDLIYIDWLERRPSATGPFDPSNPNATNKGIPIHRPLKESGPIQWFIATFDDSA